MKFTIRPLAGFGRGTMTARVRAGGQTILQPMQMEQGAVLTLPEDTASLELRYMWTRTNTLGADDLTNGGAAEVVFSPFLPMLAGAAAGAILAATINVPSAALDAFLTVVFLIGAPLCLQTVPGVGMKLKRVA